MLKKTLIIISVILGIVILCIIIMFHLVLEDIGISKKYIATDSIAYINQMPKDYKELFKKYNHMTLEGTFYNKSRNPIAIFNYKQAYSILLYKISFVNMQSLNKILNVTFTDTKQPDGVCYWSVFNNGGNQPVNNIYNILYRCGRPETGHEIYLTLYGGNTHVIEKDDSIANYSSELDNFSIRYNKDGDNDIYGEVNDYTLNGRIPVQVIFKKHNNQIYLIVVIVKDERVLNNNELFYKSR